MKYIITFFIILISILIHMFNYDFFFLFFAIFYTKKNSLIKMKFIKYLHIILKKHLINTQTNIINIKRNT